MRITTATFRPKVGMQFLFCILLASSPLVKSQQQPLDLFADQHFLFTPQEMLAFDIVSYVEESAPALSNYVESIGHWSSYYSISPKVLITLIDLQTGVTHNTDKAAAAIARNPFGDLSTHNGFNKQIIDVAEFLSESYRNAKFSQIAKPQPSNSAGKVAINALLNRPHVSNTQLTLKGFESGLLNLFEQEIITESLDSSRQGAAADPATQLPFLIGESWAGGGAHSNWAALDFWSTNPNHSWGDDTSNAWVAASTPGIVRVWSSCSMSVISGDWVTGYYHLDNVQIADRATVSRNARLANYANNLNQAICQGGSSSGPHVHFSLRKNGADVPVKDRLLSSFTFRTTATDEYEGNCNLTWYERPNGSKVCPYYPLYNSGIPDPDTYMLTVVNGTGDGEYPAGHVVNISADSPPSGKKFNRWTGDTSGVQNIRSANTQFSVPATNSTITATYNNVSVPGDEDICNPIKTTNGKIAVICL